MSETKKANKRLASDFPSSQEKVQTLQEELASTKASKQRRRLSIEDISFMQSLSDSEIKKLEDKENVSDAEGEGEKDRVTPEYVPLYEGDLMAKHMAMIEKHNHRMMRVLSQHPRTPTPSIVGHRERYTTTLLVEKIVKASLSKKLNLLILTTTYIIVEGTDQLIKN